MDVYEGYAKTSADNEITISPRYTYRQADVREYVLDVIREHLTRHQTIIESGLRNLLRLMTMSCGYGEVRSLAAQRLEMWLPNTKVQRAAQDLLMSVCMNCDQHTQQDVEVISLVSKLRLKTKPLVTHYLLCIK